MMPFLAMKMEASLPYFTNRVKRSPRNTPLTQMIWMVVRMADVHSSKTFDLISNSCSGDSRKPMQTTAIIPFSNSFGTPWQSSFSSRIISSISTPSKRSNAMRRDTIQISSLYLIESVPVLRRSSRRTGDKQRVIFKIFGPKKASLSSLSSMGLGPPKITPMKITNPTT